VRYRPLVRELPRGLGVSSVDGGKRRLNRRDRTFLACTPEGEQWNPGSYLSMPSWT
jgi:hypothetical protein